MGDLLESFLESVWVRIKHTEKSHVGLWEQSLILKAVEEIVEVLEKATYERSWLVEGSNQQGC